MNYSYNEMYLDDAMFNMGELTEYAAEAYGQNLDELFRMFIDSGYAAQWEAGNPGAICGISGTELYGRIMERCGRELTDQKPPLIRYDTGKTFWCGFILAYYQWRSGERFAEIMRHLSCEDLLAAYPALHTASEERAADEIQAMHCRRKL